MLGVEGEEEEGEGCGGEGVSIAELQHARRVMLASQSLLFKRVDVVASALISQEVWGSSSLYELRWSLTVASGIAVMLRDLVADATCAADAIHTALVSHIPDAYKYDTAITPTLAAVARRGGAGALEPQERLASEFELLRGRLQSGVARLTLSLQRMQGEGGQGKHARIRKEVQEDLRYVADVVRGGEALWRGCEALLTTALGGDADQKAAERERAEAERKSKETPLAVVVGEGGDDMAAALHLLLKQGKVDTGEGEVNTHLTLFPPLPISLSPPL
jgi:hypothetical protein